MCGCVGVGRLLLGKIHQECVQHGALLGGIWQ